jgi:hypothetical protein
MTLRTDHIAGAFFILFAIAVLSVSGDLPIGRLSMPGSGMMPTLACSLIILFGLLLILRGSDSGPLAELRWNDLPHAGRVIAIAAAAVVGYTALGFALTMALMLFALIAVGERRNPIYAALYSVGVVALTYFLFAVVLKTPLETGIFGF